MNNIATVDYPAFISQFVFHHRRIREFGQFVIRRHHKRISKILLFSVENFDLGFRVVIIRNTCHCLVKLSNVTRQIADSG